MSTRSVLGLALLAVLGLAVAAAITLAASSLTSQRVGLSSEPTSAGDALVSTVETTEDRPAVRRPGRTTRTTTTPARTTPGVTTPATPPPVATTDDHGGDDGSGGSGRGRGRGRGRGGDD